MATATFSGPLRVGNSDGVTGTVPVDILFAVAATAVANTDTILVMPPQGYRLKAIKFVTNTSFTGTTATCQVGTTAGGAEVVAAVNVKPIAEVNATLVPALAAIQLSMATPLFIRLTQTGPTAVGFMIGIASYIPLPPVAQ